MERQWGFVETFSILEKNVLELKRLMLLTMLCSTEYGQYQSTEPETSLPPVSRPELLSPDNTESTQYLVLIGAQFKYEV